MQCTVSTESAHILGASSRQHQYVIIPELGKIANILEATVRAQHIARSPQYITYSGICYELYDTYRKCSHFRRHLTGVFYPSIYYMLQYTIYYTGPIPICIHPKIHTQRRCSVVCSNYYLILICGYISSTHFLCQMFVALIGAKELQLSNMNSQKHI